MTAVFRSELSRVHFRAEPNVRAEPRARGEPRARFPGVLPTALRCDVAHSVGPHGGLRVSTLRPFQRFFVRMPGSHTPFLLRLVHYPNIAVVSPTSLLRVFAPETLGMFLIL